MREIIARELFDELRAERDTLKAENNRLREALEEAEPYFCEMPAVLENKLRALLAAGKGTSPDLSADPAAYDRIADRELGPAAGKGETVPTEKCAQCGKQTEETFSCSDGVNEAIRVCADCRGGR